MRNLDPAMALELLGNLGGIESMPKVVAVLPFDQASVAKVKDFLILSNAVLPKALSYCGRYDDSRDFTESVMQLPRIFSSLSERIGESGGLAAFNWRKTVMILESLEGSLPKETPSELRSSFGELVNRAVACGEDWGQASLIVRVCGDEEDVERVMEEILNEVVDQVDGQQQKLAGKYGWKRAQTPCCSEMGYIVPDRQDIGPIHEVKHPKDQEDPHQGFMGNLAAMIREGRVQVVMGDINDLPPGIDPRGQK